MTFGDPCPGCNGQLTGGCPMCNPKIYVNETVPSPWAVQRESPVPVKYNIIAPQTYQPIPEPGHGLCPCAEGDRAQHGSGPTQRERVVVQLLAGLIGAGMDDAAALNKAFELAELVIKRLNASF